MVNEDDDNNVGIRT